MRNILAIAQREVRAYFATPVGWICMFGFLALSGLFFALFTMLYAEEAANQTFNPYMGNQLCWKHRNFGSGQEASDSSTI